MLDLLHHLALVAEHRTFTAAARHAHITQPALTASIQRLESLLGARLFDRGPRGATLTAAGEALLPRARAAIAAVNEGRRAVAEIVGLSAGSVRVGAGATVCTYYLPRALARFRGAHPGVHIRVREGTADDLLDALEGGDIDLAVLAEVRNKRGTAPRTPLPGGLVRERWLVDELVLVAAPGTPLAPTTPLVTFPRGASTRLLTDRYFSEHPLAMELASIATVKANTRAGVGVALVSRRAVERDVALGQLVVLPTPVTPIARPLSLVHRGKARLPPAVSALHDDLIALARSAAPAITRRRRPDPRLQ